MIMAILIVDDKEIRVQEGKNLLQACLERGIYIPNLCYIDGMASPSASCRMCFVEIEGKDKPIPSCTVKTTDGMVVSTNTPLVRRLQRTGLQLLLSVHHVDCAHCPANKNCELQRIARFLKVGLKPKQLQQRLKEPDIDESHPLLAYYPNRCVLCGKCIIVCRNQRGQGFLTFAKRGIDTVVSSYGVQNERDFPPDKCLACVEICPVGAITLKSNRDAASQIHGKASPQ
jgi:bidirectional [NiFe] hydrogenase diaphorase subunit